MKRFLLLLGLFPFVACKHKGNHVFRTTDLLMRVNNDSLIFNRSENTYYDKFGDSSGSYYQFNKKNVLKFYCFLNGHSYPFAEYYDINGNLDSVIGKPSVQLRFTKENDSTYRFSFLYSTFRKSNFRIFTKSNFDDSAYNTLAPAKGYSNIGYFNIIFNDTAYARRTVLFNTITYFDSVKNANCSFLDTIRLFNAID
jgi:hypothetical protein